MLEVEESILGDLRVAPSRAEYLRHNQRMVNRVATTDFDDPYYVLQIADYDVDSITPFELKQTISAFRASASRRSATARRSTWSSRSLSALS